MQLRHIGYLAFYLLRPVFWPEIRRKVWSKLRRLLWRPVDETAAEVERTAATDWCAEHAVSWEEALGRLGLSRPDGTLESLFPVQVTEARERLATCPVQLGGAGNLDLLYAICESQAATRVIETGVAYGWSSLAILLSLQNRTGARLFSVDLPYFNLRNDRWVGIAVPPYLREPWQLFRMADREGLPRALKAAGRIDLAHYDSDKSAAGRRFAYRLLWQALHPGGVLISDDVGDNLGFRRFCEEISQEPVIVRQAEKFQGILVKSPP